MQKNHVFSIFRRVPSFDVGPFFLIVVAIAFVITTDLRAETVIGEVVRVLDGDTIIVAREQERIVIRLSDIDCPEKDQEFGREAKEAISGFVMHKNVSVLIRGKDRYGRTIGTVYLSGDNINFRMIESGFAWWFYKYSRDELYRDAEILARKQNRGLWLNPSPLPPWEFRKLKTLRKKSNET
ncbi:nuclease [Leptospira langatensis]|uniref:Nuclease n=1 Tax=Leptospira langatensis TaxID=2484983 RepID=A0A5R2ATH8_9LEPT|nr:thermonuclease family protein [Leptospira langatensis]TGJ99870.1 nuclease [Leptospira langatensis]